MDCRACIAVVGLAAAAWAAEPAPRATASTGLRKPLKISNFDSTIPQFVDGDSWQTSIVLQNLVTITVYYQVFLSDDAGNEQAFDIEGYGRVSTLTGQLGPGQSVEFKTTGTGTTLTQGYASVFNFDRPPDQPASRITEARAGGYAIFRRRLPGLPDQEAVVPISSYADRSFFIPFDNRDGFLTGIALVNDTNQGGTLSATAVDPAGNVIASDTAALVSGAKLVYLLKDRMPATAGRNGAVFFSISAGGLAGLGLRFNPTGSFTSTHPLSY